MFKLALIQMRVIGGERETNLKRARDLIAQAAAHEAQVALLPEAMDLGWTHPSAKVDAEPIPDGHTARALAEAARAHGVYVCSGLVERDADAVYNAAILIDPAGRVILHHRKLNELDIGHEFYGQGDRLGVARTPLGTFGLMICADAFAMGHVVSRSLGYMGADMILSPSAWAVPSDHDNAREPYGSTWQNCYEPVARDFQMWIAGVSNVGVINAGPWQGHNCIGCSLIVGPDGQSVARGPYGQAAEAILYVDVHLRSRPARGTSWTSIFYRP